MISSLVGTFCFSLVALNSVQSATQTQRQFEQSDIESQIGTQTTPTPSQDQSHEYRQNAQMKNQDQDQDQDQTQKIGQVMSLISPSEVQLLKQDQPLATTPLAYEVKMSDLWNLGYQEAQNQATHSAKQLRKLVSKVESSPSEARSHLGLTRFLNKFQFKHGQHATPQTKDFIQAFNQNNTFVIDAQTMCQQIMWAYQAGGLHALNQQLGTKYIVPYQKASNKQIQKLLSHDQQKHAFETMAIDDMPAFSTLGENSFDDNLFNSIAVKADENQNSI